MTRRFLSIVLLLLPVISASCSGSLFKVKPATELPPLPANTRSADAGGVTIRVAPLLSDEESQELFEANLPLSGVLPLRMELAFQSGMPVELKKARFRLRDGQNREWKLLSPKSAISRIMKANGVTLYNPNSRKQFEREFVDCRPDQMLTVAEVAGQTGLTDKAVQRAIESGRLEAYQCGRDVKVKGADVRDWLAAS